MLNRYQFTVNKKWGLENFQWTLDGRIARSKQPGYTGHDTDHEFTGPQRSFLFGNSFRCVISANEFNLGDESKTILDKSGVKFYNYKVKDMHSATPAELREIAGRIDKCLDSNGKVLVYCGYGQGRTGHFIAAWALIHYLPRQTGAFIPNVRGIISPGYMKYLFGVEDPGQVQNIRAAFNAAFPPAYTGGDVAPLRSAPHIPGAPTLPPNLGPAMTPAFPPGLGLGAGLALSPASFTGDPFASFGSPGMPPISLGLSLSPPTFTGFKFANFCSPGSPPAPPGSATTPTPLSGKKFGSGAVSEASFTKNSGAGFKLSKNSSCYLAPLPALPSSNGDGKLQSDDNLGGAKKS